jgi:hypothetical protein
MVNKTVTGDQESLMYLCHGFARLINEFGIVIADEGIWPGLCGILEAAHLIANGFGISSEGS